MPVDKQDFWSKKKEEFLMQMQSQGYDLFGCQDFIEQKGMVSMDSYLLTDNLMNQMFINPLKVAPQIRQNPQNVVYGYQPNLLAAPMGMQ